MHALLLETIALVGGTLHTMDPGPGGELVEPFVGTVLIEDGRITGVGADLAVPEGARTVDAAGLHVAPGLIDGWVSFDAEHDVLYLAAGVTTVRDKGSPIGAMLKEAAPAMRDRHPGPTLLASSPVFADAGSNRSDLFRLGDPRQAAEQIGEVVNLLGQANARVHGFLIDRAIDAPRHAVVCAAAREYGSLVWGPVPLGMTVESARGQGQAGLVGLDSLLPLNMRFEQLPDLTPVATNIEKIGEGAWSVVPLLMGTARISRALDSEGEPAVLAALGGTYEVAWRADLESFALIEASGGRKAVDVTLERQSAMAKAMHDRGAQLVPGSGAPSGGIAPGKGLVDELEEWARIGIPAAEVLDLATRRAAIALGADDRGRIATGLAADLIVLGSDPERSVSALRDPEIVITRGRVLERFDLDDLVAGLVAKQEAARAERTRPIAVERAPVPEGEVIVDDVANLVTYGSRTAVERYTVVQLEDGRRAYGARVHVLPTGTSPAKEMVLVQTIEDGLVESFDLTVDALNEKGEPQLDENGEHAFYARGRRVEESRKIAIERYTGGFRISMQRAEEAIAAIDGSAVLVGLIAAREFPEGPSFVCGFESLAMEPIVDRAVMRVSKRDGRLYMEDTRGARAYGFGPNGEMLFGATARAGGRLELENAEIVGAAKPIHALEIAEERRFTGDPEKWADPEPEPESTGDSNGR